MHGVTKEMKQAVLTRLKAAEEEHNVRVLYACESGSRAWGFASIDSDYDVRFIYARPEAWYLSFDVERRRDVIEYPIVDEIDCGGWDIRKALYLFTRTNGALLEWLNSPIKYIETGTFAQNLRKFAPQSFNYIALCYHYSHMARGNAREYLFKEQVRLKKYFYVLRPLLALRFIEEFSQPPPVALESLVQAVAPDSIQPAIAYLLQLKRNTPELGLGDQIPEINAFINTELERHKNVYSGQGRPDLLTMQECRDTLNVYFRKALHECRPFFSDQ
jgi:predicted nucleotidyltransferase